MTTMDVPVEPGGSSAAIDNGLLAILAVAAGLTVANNYYNQATCLFGVGWGGTCLFGAASATVALLLSRRS